MALGESRLLGFPAAGEFYSGGLLGTKSSNAKTKEGHPSGLLKDQGFLRIGPLPEFNHRHVRSSRLNRIEKVNAK